LSIELRNDFRAPMFRDLREFIGKIYGIHIFCLTSKVSRDHAWREACVSTIRDKHDRWL
jgi:hypothetical protein